MLSTGNVIYYARFEGKPVSKIFLHMLQWRLRPYVIYSLKILKI